MRNRASAQKQISRKLFAERERDRELSKAFEGAMVKLADSNDLDLNIGQARAALSVLALASWYIAQPISASCLARSRTAACTQ